MMMRNILFLVYSLSTMFSAFAPHQYQFFEEAIAGWWWLLVCERSICFVCFVELILYHLGKEGVTRLYTNLAKYLLKTMVLYGEREEKEEVM